MMKKIITLAHAIEIAKKERAQGKTLVLSGGCFDILHSGHIAYIKQAKEQGDILFLLLESDKAIRQLKGPTRPITPQKERAEILANLIPVDYVILLPYISSKNYDEIIAKLNPHVLATTSGDPARFHKERQATQIGATVKDVTPLIENRSTSRIAALLAQDLHL